VNGSGGPILPSVVRRVQVEASKADVGIARLLGPLLESWYGTSGRRFAWRFWRDEYRVLITEVLLQRTRADAVEAGALRFFARYPGWPELAMAKPADIAAQLQPLGLSARRARSLHALARYFAGSPRDRAYEDLPGVGQYIARATRVSMDGSAEAMVDSNFVRVLHRVFGGDWMADYRHDRRLQALALQVVISSSDPRVVNWAVVDLGALICKPRRPDCAHCPLRHRCEWASGSVTLQDRNAAQIAAPRP
jgi:A/G-specific adenine glycosylase